MEYTQRENIINGLREAIGMQERSTNNIKTKTFNAGTGTLHILNTETDKDNARQAVQYFNSLLKTTDLPEKTYYELAVSSIIEQFDLS